MSEAKHTPGPWRRQWTVDNKRTHIGHWFFVSESEGNPIVHLKGKYFQNREGANARLIAAAPELLEALEELLSDSRDAEELTHGSHTNCGWCKAIAAIRKAKGEL